MSAKSEASSSAITDSTSCSDTVLDSDALLEAASDEQLATHREPCGPAKLEDPRRAAPPARSETGSPRSPSTVSTETREKARVRSEEPGRRRDAIEVAALVADDERRPVENA